jgi:hypothetical protein
MTQNVEVIDQLLAQWKEKAVAYYRLLKKELAKVSHADYSENSTAREQNEAMHEAHLRKKEWAVEHSKSTMDILSYTGIYFEEHLQKVLNRDVETKRKTLISRIEKKAGKIIDVDGLHIAENGEINGVIVGSLSTVEVQTITAGGWNVQMLHYRVLVKVIKE